MDADPVTDDEEVARLATMRTHSGLTASESLWDRPELKYLPPDDFARLDYGRLLWASPAIRARLIAHWTDSRHRIESAFWPIGI